MRGPRDAAGRPTVPEQGSTDNFPVRRAAGLQYEWQAAAVAGIGLSLSLLDNTIVSIALPAMQRTFGTDFSAITWVGAGYFLASAAVIGATGYLSDAAGTKRVYLAAMALLTGASAMCMIAPTVSLLVVMRITQGIGGGALWPISFAIAYRAFPPAERGRATAVIGVPVLLAPALGPVAGGYLTTMFGWRAIFAINIPVGVAALILAGVVLRSRAQDAEEEEEEQGPERASFDVIGFVLSTVSFTILVAGLTEAGSRGWTDPLVDALLAAGAFTFIVFVLAELRTRHPVLDLRLFLDATFARANVLLWILVAFYYGGVYLIPYFFENIRGYSAMASGEILIGQGAASAVAIAAAGALYNRIGPRFLAVAGTVLLAVSMVGSVNLGVGTTGRSLELWLILRGLGLGLVTPALQNLTVAVVSRQEVARASSLVNVTQQVAGATGLGGLAAFMAARTAVHRAALSTAGPELGCSAGPPHGTAVASCLHRHAAVRGLDDTFMLVAAGYVACIILASIVGSDPSLRTKPEAGPEDQSPDATRLSPAGLSG